MSRSLVAEVTEAVRARYPLLYVVTWEEERAVEALRTVSADLSKELWLWTVTDGLRRDGRPAPVPAARSEGDTADLRTALDALQHDDAPRLVVLLDAHSFLGDPRILRKLRDLAPRLRRSHSTVVLVSPTLRLPTDLSKDVGVIDLELPEGDVITENLDRILEALHARSDIDVSLPDAAREKLERAAQGLTLTEFENAITKAVVRSRALDRSAVQVVLEEKRQVIRKSGVLDFYAPDSTFDHVGGLDALKGWLRKRGDAFSDRARSFGIPAPRGLMLVGVQGCGKSLTAKAIANQWQQPLLRLDVGRVFAGTVGSSEENMRTAIRIVESLAPVVLWVDEVEKGFAGTASSHYSDAGTAARVFGTFMTWLQEKTRAVFVVATANDVRQLPPEMLRKGRFDEIFFIDLPSAEERMEIFRIHLKKRDRNPDDFDLDGLAKESRGFSGSEIEEAVIGGLYEAFSEGRRLETADILGALAATVPLSRTMDHDVEALRTWAQGRARRATSGSS